MASKMSAHKHSRSSLKKGYYERQKLITSRNKTRRATARKRKAAKWPAGSFNRYKTPQRIARRARKLHVKFSSVHLEHAVAIKDFGLGSHAVKSVEIHQAQIEGRIRQLNQPQPATL